MEKLVEYSNEYKIVKEKVLKLEEGLVSLHTDINQRVLEVGFGFHLLNKSTLFTTTTTTTTITKILNKL